LGNPAESNKQTETIRTHNKKPKILIVDDETLVRELMKDILKECGYEVAEAENGEKAIAMIGESSYDLLITDIKMPGTNGIVLLQNVRVSYPDTKVIVITGYPTDEERDNCFSHGAADFIAKQIGRASCRERV